MRNLIFKTADALIENNDFSETIISNLNIENYIDIDQWMHEEVTKINGKGVFCNVFIPLCFGAILTDYLGLRLAHHIRMTEGKNQLVNVFIYGTENIDSILKNEFVSILRTKGVCLIDYSLSAIRNSSNKTLIELNLDDLIPELHKIQLQIPSNLSDSHSVANIWGMYRLLELEGIEASSITTLKTRKNNLNNIYFKWLVAKNNTGKLINKEIIETRQGYADSLAGLKIVGKIDLSQFTSKKKKI